MKIIRQNVGIDVDSKELKVSYKKMLEDLSIKTIGSRTFKNTVVGFKALKVWIEKKNGKRIIHSSYDGSYWSLLRKPSLLL